MATVRFTPHLRQFFELPDQHVVCATDLAELVARLDETWRGLGFYLVDERGHIRQHVAVWVDGTLIRDREDLTTPLCPDSRVTILQALSGG